MTAVRLVEVSLVRAWSPSEPDGQEGNRIRFRMALDAQGAPDEAAWLADPDPWPAQREAPGAPPAEGDVAHDEEGWSLRFAQGGLPLADAPPHRILGGAGWLRPGEVVTIRGPEGGEVAWRVVAVA
ncbi:hypothetical protein [Falsiroseomonas selenitidurans]|uniref:Uncharacterized protein n=1 Tax=Falsiroseomonas selenitidurans TaxID=2716335 RepID=A0ABX1E9Z7_9PROT|nr:hypothetical protein [Falsiroseomonas selenitidurans]NKC32588.1 hypothetical protein [Falsiroseomonas selenitidurans]